MALRTIESLTRQDASVPTDSKSCTEQDLTSSCRGGELSVWPFGILKAMPFFSYMNQQMELSQGLELAFVLLDMMKAFFGPWWQVSCSSEVWSPDMDPSKPAFNYDVARNER